MQYHSLFRALTYGFKTLTVVFSLIPLPLSERNNVPTVFFNIRAALLPIGLTERFGVSASKIVSITGDREALLETCRVPFS